MLLGLMIFSGPSPCDLQIFSNLSRKLGFSSGNPPEDRTAGVRIPHRPFGTVWGGDSVAGARWGGGGTWARSTPALRHDGLWAAWPWGPRYVSTPPGTGLCSEQGPRGPARPCPADGGCTVERQHLRLRPVPEVP